MTGIFKTARFWSVAVAAGLILSLFFIVSVGCGDSTTTTGAKTAKTTAQGKGTIYVAVTGAGELQAGAGNMGMAVVDLDTKKVEMVNLAEAKAPHGIIFSADTMTAPDTDGRIATEIPKTIYLGNAQDGSVNVIDLATRKVTKTISAPSGAKLAICGMQKGADGKIYLTSMGDGKVYMLDGTAGTITDYGVGGGDVTQSICGIAWTKDGKYAYLSNMFNPNDPTMAGYVAKVEWPSGKLVKKIENVTKVAPGGTPMAHQSQMTPDGKFLYVTDGADGSVVKIDLGTDTIAKTIPVGKEPHAIVFSADGKTAYISVRHEPVENQSSVFVYDVEKDQVTDRIPGIPAPLICGLVWSP
ncbi:MAG: YncE family protein [Thermoleophilia bacterium]